MCDPVSVGIASLAISTATAGIGFMQQSQQASARNKAVRANYSQQIDTFQTQQAHVNKQATDEMSARARENQIEAARLRVVNGESGLFGNTNDRILGESYFNLGTDVASIESNRAAQQKQLIQDAKSIRAGTQTQISQITRPSLIGTGLQIASGATDAATIYKGLKAPRSKTLPLS
jgi:hypothetical protein